MNVWKLGALALCGAISFAHASADAATYLVSFDGVVESGSDPNSLFGVGGDLTGKRFSGSFSFEYPSADVTATRQVIQGRGVIENVQSTSSDVVLTIDGHSVSMGSDNVAYDRAALDNALSLDARSDYIVLGRNSSAEYRLSLGIKSQDPSFFSSLEPFDPVDFTYNNGRNGVPGTGLGFFDISISSPSRTASATGHLVPYHVQVKELVAGVPEPATWALMILGLGAVGGQMRARRSRLARTA